MHLPRHAELWLGGYLSTLMARRRDPEPRHIWVAIADHFEPYYRNHDDKVALDRVLRWRERWPVIANRIADRLGELPKYTFFYPEEEYRKPLLDLLTEMTHEGIADVEVHLHHDGEGEQNFVDRMTTFIDRLHYTHGLLRRWKGKTAFGFIHGDWCLDNAHPQGLHCGLNNELTLLAKLGCYADFTLPVTAWSAQTRVLNTIYWADDDPEMPRSHDTGRPVAQYGIPESESGLLLVPGPFGIWFRNGRPKIDTGELADRNLGNKDRAKLWFEMAPRIHDHAFLKLYTHGAKEANAEALLGSGIEDAMTLISAEAAKRGANLHLISTWEMRQKIEQLCNPDGAIASESLEQPERV